MQYILFVHRYLAVAVGLLMTLWCLSGFVMMYQSYPALEAEERLRGLAPLQFDACCDLAALPFDDAARAPAFRVEMLLGDPVLRLSGGGRQAGGADALNLRTGQPVPELTQAQVLEVARAYGAGNAIAGTPRSLGIIDMDQWTIQSARRNAPTWHIAFDDRARTEIYVSGASGEVFQDTNRRERALSWLGAIPHWLYPTLLRQNGALWTQIVIWTSVAGTFLAATGLYVGLARLRRRADGKIVSPFRGWWYWHHITGLVFGVLTLTWVFSGLMTMNPWGTLSSGGGANYGQQITGGFTWGEVRQLLTNHRDDIALEGVTQLRPVPFGGELYVMAQGPNGVERRLDASGVPVSLGADEVQGAVAKLGVPVRELRLLEGGDSYHYGARGTPAQPVFRALLEDEGQTRLYINPQSGAVRSVGATARVSRWIRTGLHSLDFPVLRARPLWDIAVILLLAGVTAVCATGTWLAWKRVKLDVRRQRSRLRRFLTERTPGEANLDLTSRPRR